MKFLKMTLYCFLLHLPWMGFVFGGSYLSFLDRMRNGLEGIFEWKYMTVIGPYFLGLIGALYIVVIKNKPSRWSSNKFARPFLI